MFFWGLTGVYGVYRVRRVCRVHGGLRALIGFCRASAHGGFGSRIWSGFVLRPLSQRLP